MTLRKLGRYDIVRVLGKGAMGTVYEALDPNLERRVAIKTIAMQGLSEQGVAEYEARFRTEARSAARLQHPNIVSVYDAGRDGEIAYLVMEYVQGQDLKHHLDSGVVFTLEQSLRLMRDLLAALAYAHAQNIVHRDVKPANLLVEADGRVKLTDFGVARIQDAVDATRTRGAMVGTLKYMAPEQVQGQPIDARADLFSAGIVLYQLLTARQPFRGDNAFTIIAQIVGVDPPAPTTLQPGLPAAIDDVLACALAKAPRQRFADARAFHDALAQACDQAQDLSTRPMPLDSGSGSGSGSRSWRRTATASGSGASGTAPSVSMVTQELELVYWKDVRESDDALDLQGFLDRFPDGIYADLARRRLRRLGVVFLGEQTATQVEPRNPGMDAGAGGSPRVAVSANDAARAQAVGANARQGTSHRKAVLRRSAAVAAMLLVVVLAWWLLAGDGGADRTLANGATVPPTAAVSRSAPDAALPASDSTDAAAQAVSTPAVAAQADGAPMRNRPADAVNDSRARAGASGAMPPRDAGATVRAVALPAPASPRMIPGTATPIDKAPAAQEPQSSSDPNPEQACAGRVLLGYQICMSEQCAKPAYAGHAVCEQRRAAEQARKQQQSNRN